MKRLCLFGSLVLINVSVFAQSSKKLSLKDWIKQKGYIALTDEDHLPKTILPYYKPIKDSVIKYHLHYNWFPDFATSYTMAKYISENDSTYSITIYPIDGLKLIKYYEDKKVTLRYDKKTKMYVQIIDDIGGSVGEISVSLNKVTGKFTFLRYQ